MSSNTNEIVQRPQGEQRVFRLSDVLNTLESYIYQRAGGKKFWFTTEISQINQKGGHYYLDLIEQDNNKVIAKCQGRIWNRQLFEIEKKLGQDASNVLKKGNEILCLGEIAFHKIYGLSISIYEVDINYTLGNLEKKKQETINRLKEESLLDLNKQLEVPVVVQKIALIGSPETSGFTDFKEQLSKNSYGYIFFVSEFSCSVQGLSAEKEILSRLNQVKKLNFDVVCLVRGGGSKLDLEVFNSYDISRTIASMNHPVWTGIGHETDFSVADLVANEFFKTPTALGSAIIEKAHTFHVAIQRNFDSIMESVKVKLSNLKSTLSLTIESLKRVPVSKTRLERGQLFHIFNQIRGSSNDVISRERSNLTATKNQLYPMSINSLTKRKSMLFSQIELVSVLSKTYLRKGKETLFQDLNEMVEHALKYIGDERTLIENQWTLIQELDPKRILEKGYSIVYFNNRLVKRDTTLSEGDEIVINLAKRTISTAYNKDLKTN